MKLLKRICTLGLASVFTFSNITAQGIDSTSLPGDQFSLEAALELFKKASSPEDFERLLNTEGNDANNLDLNEDGETDYIKVIDKTEGLVHAFILQVAVSETEDQDIAVIELEKTGESTAVLQIVGDEDIYGEEQIVEPADENSASLMMETDLAYAHGPSQFDADNLFINVWLWPSVRFVYHPSYVVWRSPFRWRARPIWFRPWRPVHYSVFYPRRAVYRPRYVVVHTHRVVRARAIYRPVRVTSVTVVHRNQANVGRYRASRTVQRTNVTTGNRNVQGSRKTTTITGKNGNTVKKTKTKVRRKK